MLLVMIAVALATIISLTFMTAATTVTGAAQMVDDHAQARQVAESGLELGKSYLERDPAWREDQVNGVWVSEFPLLGGKVSLKAAYDDSAPVTAIAVTNASFESGTKSLANGFMGLNPDLSGTIYGWTAKRNSVAPSLTALTLPAVGVKSSGAATDGSNIAYAKFAVGLAASASFSRTLTGVTLEPLTTYTLEVDVINVSVADVLPACQLVVKAGGSVVASAGDGNLLTLLDLNANASTQALRFTTTDSPASGNVTIEIGCSVLVGALQTIGFDNVRFVKEKPVPVLLTATATHGNAGHVVSAMVMPMGNTTPARIMEWTDP